MLKFIFQFLLQQKYWAVIVAILWTALIFILCLKEGSGFPKVRVPHLDKIVHILFYTGMSFLWSLVCAKNKYRFVIVLAFCLFTGIGIELLQDSVLVKNRSFEWMDIGANTLGTIIGLGIYLYFWKKYIGIKS